MRVLSTTWLGKKEFCECQNEYEPNSLLSVNKWFSSDKTVMNCLSPSKKPANEDVSYHMGLKETHSAVFITPGQCTHFSKRWNEWYLQKYLIFLALVLKYLPNISLLW